MISLETLSLERKIILQKLIQQYIILIYSEESDSTWHTKAQQIWNQCDNDIEKKWVANTLISTQEKEPSLFEMATEEGHWRACLDLLKQGSDSSVPFSSGRYLWSSLLKSMIRNGWIAIGKDNQNFKKPDKLDQFLLFLEKVAPHTPASTGQGEWGSVQNIVMLRNPFIVEPALNILKASGHDLDMQDSFGETGFLLACWLANPKLIQWFSKQGVKIDTQTQGGWGAWEMMTRSSTLISKYEPDFEPQLFEALNTLNIIFPCESDLFQKIIEEKLHRLEDRIPFQKWLISHQLPQSKNTSGKSIRL